MKSPDELTERFRSQGLKVTPQRRRVFEVLHDNHHHPSAEAVFDAVRVDMPTISLRTVYQTLHDLADMGELTQFDVGTGSTRFDPNLDAHHHLVCERCGQVLDVHADFEPAAVPRAGAEGFQITSTEIVFRGVCAQCAPAGDRADSTN